MFQIQLSHPRPSNPQNIEQLRSMSTRRWDCVSNQPPPQRPGHRMDVHAPQRSMHIVHADVHVGGDQDGTEVAGGEVEAEI